MKRFLLVFLMALSALGAKADEGMWLPFLVGQQKYNEMVELGLKLTPEQLYSINHSSLKDAIVRLGSGFCTGEMVSDQGLLLTNHHCGFDAIQQHSSTEHDYLRDGFWAMKKSDELPADFSVSFLVRIEEVSDQVLKDVTESMTLEKRYEIISKNAKALTDSVAKENKFYSGQVKNMFNGNAYYLYVYKTYNDVRLVGAPPSSIGKYGRDTDNWMWPRHTGDFSIFRVYADKNNEPAEYSKDNVPYQPKHHLPVSMKGVEKDDYAMIFGYPGSTDRYLTSYGVNWATDYDQPARVKIRRAKLDTYEAYMATSQEIEIMYATKQSRVSNYWKYFIGQTRGLKRLNVEEKKRAEEKEFNEWANSTAARKAEYGDVIKMFEEAYAMKNKYALVPTYLNEAIFGIENLSYSYGFMQLEGLLEGNAPKEDVDKELESLKSEAEAHFKDYYKPIDLKVFAEMIAFYIQDIDEEFHPEYLKKLNKKFNGNYTAMAEWVFKKSIMDDKEAVLAFLNKPSAKKLQKDPAYKLLKEFITLYRGSVSENLKPGNELLVKAQRLYLKGLLEMSPDKHFYPDANSTMRMTYGTVQDYYPADAVHYNYYTTIDGVMEKYIPGNYEFDLPQRFIDLYKKKEYGPYAVDGELWVCFLTNNDITGGNSGSPVINGNGELIGTAFDGNWEAMSGDIAFEPDLQRTISVDIRYTLWIIDIYAGAGHLVEEMTLIR